MPSRGRLRPLRARSCSPSFRLPTSRGASLPAPSEPRPSASLLLVGGAADELLLGNRGQVILLVLEVLLDLFVTRRFQELALLDLGQDLAAGLRLLAAVLARVGDLPRE